MLEMSTKFADTRRVRMYNSRRICAFVRCFLLPVREVGKSLI